jgi:hypothetical protein
MKNKYRKLVKANNLQPLKDLSELNDKREVFGVGWDGQFQKGIVTNDNRYVKFENEMGGTKCLEQGFVDEVYFGKQYKTVHSGLYFEILT